MLLGENGQLALWETALSEPDFRLCEFIHASYQWDELKMTFLVHHTRQGSGDKSAFEMIAPVIRHAFSGVTEAYHLRDVDALHPLFQSGQKRGWSFEAVDSPWLQWLAQHEPVLGSETKTLRHFVIFGEDTCLHMICPSEPTFREVF